MTVKQVPHARLCYINPYTGLVYFTTRDPWYLQVGDDWNDAPYEHNAGDPYEWRDGVGEPPYELHTLAYQGDFVLPNDGQINSSYSVLDINGARVPWLTVSRWSNEERREVALDYLYAGASIPAFIHFVRFWGGEVLYTYSQATQWSDELAQIHSRPRRRNERA